eukprot:scaffold170764_cov15-Tisochrysis_lutea.AAC.1
MLSGRELYEEAELSLDTGLEVGGGEFGGTVETEAKGVVAESARFEDHAAEEDEPVVDGVRAARRDKSIR